jgi:predicted ABC-type ATPase
MIKNKGAILVSEGTPAVGEAEVPSVYMVAGPNGAGKTTFAAEFLPGFVNCREFLNADLIAAGLSPFAPETQNLRAGRLLLTRIKELTRARQDFGFETTLSGRSYITLLNRIKNEGYRVVMFFLWLPSADLAVARVKNRVRQGGHQVPEAVIRRRFGSGIRNLFQLYRPLLDAWWLYNASHLPPTVIAQEQHGKLELFDSKLFAQIKKSSEA